jgi:hypothetical protein
MVNVSLLSLAAELHASLSTIQWVTSGYLLALAVMLPLTGWLVDRIGAKALYLCGQGAGHPDHVHDRPQGQPRRSRSEAERTGDVHLPWLSAPIQGAALVIPVRPAQGHLQGRKAQAAAALESEAGGLTGGCTEPLDPPLRPCSASSVPRRNRPHTTQLTGQSVRKANPTAWDGIPEADRGRWLGFRGRSPLRGCV